jgi:HD-like signal output (HDOD) protein
MTLVSMFEHPNTLPAAPKVVQELIASFNSDTIAIDQIARKIAVDPVLSAKLLRLANSAYYHVSRSVGTVDDAIAMLGFVTVRTLVISNGLVNGFKAVPGLDLNQFWLYSLHTAVAARWLAQQAGQNSDEAFTVGMMHAIGALVMHSVMPAQMQQLDKLAGLSDARRLDVERNTFGYTFAEVGAELARRWKFPDVFAIAIENFPQPAAHEEFLPMSAILHIAAWLARADACHWALDEMRASCPTAMVQRLGLAPNVMLEGMPAIAELAAGMEELVT